MNLAEIAILLGKKFMIITREKIADSLYTRTQVRSSTTKEVVGQMVKDLSTSITTTEYDKLIDIIRPYKQTGTHLEQTVNKIYEVLNDSDKGSGSFGFGSTYLNNPPNSITPANGSPVNNLNNILGNPAKILPTTARKTFNLTSGLQIDACSYIPETTFNAAYNLRANNPLIFPLGPQFTQEEYIQKAFDFDPNIELILQQDNSVIMFSPLLTPHIVHLRA